MTNRLFELIYENVPEDNKNKIKYENINMDSEFFQDLGYDSISFMGLLLSVEDEWEIPIIEGEQNYIFFSAISVRDLCDALNFLLN